MFPITFPRTALLEAAINSHDVDFIRAAAQVLGRFTGDDLDIRIIVELADATKREYDARPDGIASENAVLYNLYADCKYVVTWIVQCVQIQYFLPPLAGEEEPKVPAGWDHV